LVAREGLAIVSLCTRVIARLDIKPSVGVVKGRRMDGLRKVGEPCEMVQRYEDQGADEILWLDGTASLYVRDPDAALMVWASTHLFTPVTYGGGVRTFAQFAAVLRAGCEKVALNTAALQHGDLIGQCAQRFGSQAVVVSVEHHNGEAYCLGGREPTGVDALEWCIEAVSRGAGELLVTSIDRDGCRTGYDLEFLGKLRPRVSVPIVVSGGAGTPQHCVAAVQAGASAVALGAALHQGLTIGEVKRVMADEGLEVRL